MLHLGISPFRFEDLYRPAALKELHAHFLSGLSQENPTLAEAFAHYRATARVGQPDGLTDVERSTLLIDIAQATSRFVAKLFRVESQIETLRQSLNSHHPLFDFKRDFVTRRVFKKGVTNHPGREELPALAAQVDEVLQTGFATSLPKLDIATLKFEAVAPGVDLELKLAQAILSLMHFEKHLTESGQQSDEWNALKQRLGPSTVLSSLAAGADSLETVRTLLSVFERFMWAAAQFTHLFDGWSTITQPKPLVTDRLVDVVNPVTEHPEVLAGHAHHQRRRDGFKLTDRRADARSVMAEVDYCVICHERGKDSCSKGFREKEPSATHTYKKNALGIPLAGCPLEERISETHVLKSKGDSVGALAMIMLDNPMCPGTGHRICNDCMKACIFQKQEPVNIPQIETSALTDVLALPYGFEIYGFLTRFNPLNVKRPYALPDNGKRVMVVGLGPAGYTLSHYLLNEGFGVAGVDGLKIEPFEDALVGKNGHALSPIEHWKDFVSELDERVLEGFGGVSEYGITVRWDKTFLTLIHLTLARRQAFRIYGGIRFGGTLSIDDAWQLGFDHIAIAAGAGKPTIVPMKNNLIRGVRAASDFLMALQLTGAFKKDSLANLQVRLPAVVIGGGLTGVDTATELLAYYPIQVEKTLDRHELLAKTLGEDKVLSSMDADERATYAEFVAHGKEVRAERVRAKAAGEAPDFVKLVQAWGGVSLCYRRTMQESPAYRLNHEEVAKALEEGIRFVERVSPTECIADAFGAVKAVTFEKMAMVDGKLKSTGEHMQMPARTVCMAAGTSPNVTYEREYPGTFALDGDGQFFRNFEAVPAGDTLKLQEIKAHSDIGKPIGFLTSYEKQGRFISFFGDNHPTYAGNVVKAMASAKDGYSTISRLFTDAVESAEGAARDGALQTAFFERLDNVFLATVHAVNRLTPTIIEVVVKAPFAAQHFHPGQFYRLQNYERAAQTVSGAKLTMEGLALTGAWVDKALGLMSTIVLEMGASSRLCALLKVGEPVVLMGPTGTPTEIPKGETVLLAGGGLGNAVLFSIGQALRAAGCTVLYFAGFRKKEDTYRLDDLERAADQVVWAVDSGEAIAARRPGDVSFVGNIVEAMVAYATGKLTTSPLVSFRQIDRIIAIGSDRMMRAVKEARHQQLKDFLKPEHCAIGSINSPMQCMMKEICAQCLQRHVDPRTGKESFIFSCYNQDQDLDSVDFGHLNMRLKANAVLEKQTDLFLGEALKTVSSNQPTHNTSGSPQFTARTET
jgi:NADPH-dependent glutamate synthase beta subunit-like oxidoreductase/NAD(P)H-flavin reductase